MESEYMKLRRAKMLTGIKEVKVPKDIPKQSDKMKEEMALYKPAMIAYLKKNRECKLNMEGCTKVATCVHHVKGRIGEQLHKQEDWLPSCISCNLAVEVKDLEARSKGLKKSRHTKEDLKDKRA